MLDLVGTTVITAAIAVNLNATIITMPMASTQKLTAAGIAGLWIGLAIALAGTGIYAATATPVPVVGVMAALPLVAAGLAALLFHRVRSALMALPLVLLVSLNAARILGAFFLMLAVENRLSGPFPQSAGWGDIITGVAAIPLALAIARDRDGLWGRLLAWNVFGTLDLVIAIALGITSAPGSPLQLFGGDIGSTAVWMLPWSDIPTVLVPFYLVTHGIIFAHLARSRRKSVRLAASVDATPA